MALEKQHRADFDRDDQVQAAEPARGTGGVVDESAARRLSSSEVSSYMERAPRRGDDAKEAAAGGAVGGARMPYREEMEQRFGADLSGVKVSIGGGAADACDKLGAESYAQGESVAFKQQPGKWQTAHEVAHVLQQRRGIE